MSLIAELEVPDVSIIILAYRQVESLDLLLEALAVHVTVPTFEIVVVANSESSAVLEVIERHAEALPGRVVPILSRVNRGFGGGNNLGARHARGEYLVFLNDDAMIRSGWLDGLWSVLSRRPHVGAVASVLVDAEDVVLESGGSIDVAGNVWPPDRGRPLAQIAARGPRSVAYATGGSLMVRRAQFEELGGFDLQYHPAYFEDVDLSCRYWEAEHEVWTTTESVVEHAESGSTTGPVKRALQQRNGAIFRGAWQSRFVRTGVPVGAHGDELASAEAEHVVFIDDRAPLNGVGSGAARGRQHLLALAAAGFDVSLFTREPCSELDAELRAAGVRLLSDLGQIPDGEELVAIVASRPHNFELASDMAGRFPNARVVYDAEARFSARFERQIELSLPEDEPDELAEAHREMMALETSICEVADDVITISIDEAPWFEQVSSGRIHWIDPLPDTIEPCGISFQSRSGAVFVAGWEAGSDSPNGDAVRWLARSVVPLLADADSSVRIRVTGGGVPPDIALLASSRLEFVGRVENLDELTSSARVALVPTRYGAGVKLKALDAFRVATPVVASSVGSEGIAHDWRRHIHVTDAPDEWAKAVTELCSNEALWVDRNQALGNEAARHSADAALAWRKILDADDHSTLQGDQE